MESKSTPKKKIKRKVKIKGDKKRTAKLERSPSKINPSSSTDQDTPRITASNSKRNDDEHNRALRTIFVGNVPVNFNKKKFLQLVKKYGNVERMWIRGIKTPPGKMSKKVAFIKGLIPKEHPPLIVYVLFETVSDACQALNLNGEMFETRRLRVTNSLKKTYDKNKGVFVGNLPLGVHDDDVHDLFTQCGQILGVRIIRNSSTGEGKGFGYVNFDSSDAAELALQLDGRKLHNREIRVKRLLGKNKIKKSKGYGESNSRVENRPFRPKNNKKMNVSVRKDATNRSKPKKVKKCSKVELQKRILAKKLTATSKRKTITSVN